MILKKFAYSEYKDNPRYWEVEEFELGSVNLIVGNNTSGKSRTLNVILSLAKSLTTPIINYNSGKYSACFNNSNNDTIQYVAEFKEGKVFFESLIFNDELLFERDENGSGKIYNNLLEIKHSFKVPSNQLLATRRDEIQYPYLEDLYNWAINVRHFRFSKEEEKYTLAIIDSNKPVSEGQNQNVTNQAIEIFRKGKAQFKQVFINNVIKDFNSIGYDVSNIDSGSLHSVKIDSAIGNKVIGLRVFENDRKGMTDQNEMSDGMFRALSLIIHYNYYELDSKNLTVLIDDIGEGLDFERSTNLIKLLIEKSKSPEIQLIMTSNDKFVMNNTNLEYWQAISRIGGKVKMFNSFNSPEAFKKFKFTGLNNFDFFASEYFKN